MSVPQQPTVGPSVRVLVVDDQRPFRVAAAAVLRRTPGFELVGEAATGEDAIDLAVALHPDLVLMDINMPGIGGLEATRRLTTGDGAPAVFLCSTYSRSDLPPDAADSGASAYVSKSDLGPVLLRQLWDETGGLTPRAGRLPDAAGPPA
jgi:DNA-binding NarL/FixJ family response regulator